MRKKKQSKLDMKNLGSIYDMKSLKDQVRMNKYSEYQYQNLSSNDETLAVNLMNSQSSYRLVMILK